MSSSDFCCHVQISVAGASQVRLLKELDVVVGPPVRQDQPAGAVAPSAVVIGRPSSRGRKIGAQLADDLEFRRLLVIIGVLGGIGRLWLV